ncbi:phosphoribosylanthranilate isomerase [Streptomyces sp. NPDC003077]|uniref:phosphoribosylanthranilate isomerase n=1 Tax=Streptomyces sp. NPDC003077 TaxID=3154443 RepID=UPI00339FDA35
MQVAGVMDEAEAALLCAEGVDWLGLPLRLETHKEDLSETEAAGVFASIRPPHRGVLITYLTEAEAIRAFCAELGVRTVQLHGDVPAEELRALKETDPGLYVLKSLVVREGNHEELRGAVEEMSRWVDMFISDTFDPATGAKGATGLVHDWEVSAELARRSPRPLMLAGGLTPENVAAAIERVRPAAVDAHTGLEGTDGRKDRAKVRRFVTEARQAFARAGVGVPQSER